MPEVFPLPPDDAAWLAELKGRLHTAQQRAALAVNREWVLLYWQIGRHILKRQGREGWGNKVIEHRAPGLRCALPEMKGFLSRNLKYMRSFAVVWPDQPFVQELLAPLPCYHQLALLDKLKTVTNALVESGFCFTLHNLIYGVSGLLKSAIQPLENIGCIFPWPQALAFTSANTAGVK